jgi:hypothetical protein
MRSCRIFAAAALTLALAACDGLNDGSGGLFPDTTRTDAGADVAGSADGVSEVWTPTVNPDSDSQLVTTAASIVSFFGGEVVIQLDAGSVDADTTLTMTRGVFSADGQEWAGYTFGDHGFPIDPRAQLTLIAPLSWLPPGGAVDPTLGLYRISGIRLGDKLEAISDPVVSAGRITFVVSFDAFDTFVVATK